MAARLSSLVLGEGRRARWLPGRRVSSDAGARRVPWCVDFWPPVVWSGGRSGASLRTQR